MLKIRLQRVGRRNYPAFRVVVTESTRGPKSGNNVELLGTYNPHNDTTVLKDERVRYWMGKGAQVSDTVHNILVREKIIDGKKVNVLPRKSPIIKKEDSAEGNQPQEEATADTPIDGQEDPQATKEEQPVSEKDASESEEEQVSPEEKKDDDKKPE